MKLEQILCVEIFVGVFFLCVVLFCCVCNRCERSKDKLEEYVV